MSRPLFTPTPAAVAAASLAVAVCLFVAGPAAELWMPACPFHALTGWLCPLCGSTRAVLALTRGDVMQAVSFNPITVVLLMAWPLLRHRVPRFVFSAPGLGLLIVFGVLRNLVSLAPLTH